MAYFKNYNIDSVTLDILFHNPFKLKGTIKGISDLVKIIIGQFGQLFNILGLMLSHQYHLISTVDPIVLLGSTIVMKEWCIVFGIITQAISILYY